MRSNRHHSIPVFMFSRRYASLKDGARSVAEYAIIANGPEGVPG